MQTYSELAQAWAIDKPVLERARAVLSDRLIQGDDYCRGDNNAILWSQKGADKLRAHLQSIGQIPLDVAVEHPEGDDLTQIVESVTDSIADEIADQVSRLVTRRIYGRVYANLRASFAQPIRPVIRSMEAVQAIAGKS
jgi:hypothetical protein